jgi:hypothetical protein
MSIAKGAGTAGSLILERVTNQLRVDHAILDGQAQLFADTENC